MWEVNRGTVAGIRERVNQCGAAPTSVVCRRVLPRKDGRSGGKQFFFFDRRWRLFNNSMTVGPTPVRALETQGEPVVLVTGDKNVATALQATTALPDELHPNSLHRELTVESV